MPAYALVFHTSQRPVLVFVCLCLRIDAHEQPNPAGGGTCNSGASAHCADAAHSSQVEDCSRLQRGPHPGIASVFVCARGLDDKSADELGLRTNRGWLLPRDPPRTI